MELKNSRFIVEIDEISGATTAMRDPDDASNMNWILQKPLWGTVPGYTPVKTEQNGNSVVAVYKHPQSGTRVRVEKTLTETGYYERYVVENTGAVEFFLNRDNFGILMPTNCNFSKGVSLTDKCVSHLWCGGGVCWMYSARTNGEKPYLVMDLTEGAVCDYSIDYDYSLTNLGADWRGAFLLHPADRVIKPDESAALCFRFRFSDQTPDRAPLDFPNALRFSAEKYSVGLNETVMLTLETVGDPEDAAVCCEGKNLPYTVKDGRIKCPARFDRPGAYTVTARVGEKSTLLKIMAMEPLSVLLEKRARFIAEKQQYHCKGSRLDGAYLIYDNETGSPYCGKNDHNAGRERIGMGITVCRALQCKADQSLMDSLKKHRAFVERELFDSETAVVYNDVGRDNGWLRIYNFPWFSVYYLEWYVLTGEIECLRYAARILLKYYELNGSEQDSQNIEAFRILEALKKEGLIGLYGELFREFIRHADSIVRRSGSCHSSEVTWVNEMPNAMCCYLSQAYLLTGEEKYIREAEKNAAKSKAFYAHQPDFHQYAVPVRYWDDYWFGKIRSYGDVFPHYWSALTGWSLFWYDKARRVAENRRDIESNLAGNLCVYRADGSAANCYLAPYRIDMYTSDPQYRNPLMKPGTTYGKRYDPWANDQDWALYLASTLSNA